MTIKISLDLDSTDSLIKRSFTSPYGWNLQGVMRNEVSDLVSFIQKLLEHSSIKTTQIYTQISQVSIKNIKSLLDNIL
jgi:integrase